MISHITGEAEKKLNYIDILHAARGNIDQGFFKETLISVTYLESFCIKTMSFKALSKDCNYMCVCYTF